MPKNAHTSDTAYFFCVQNFKKKKQSRPTDPPNFQAKRANKPFIFLGLIPIMHYSFYYITIYLLFLFIIIHFQFHHIGFQFWLRYWISP